MKQKPDIDTTLSWLANEIFTTFPQEVTSLKFSILGCGCIYYQRVFEGGSLDPQIGTYRDATHGACEICIAHSEDWGDRVIDECVILD